MPEGFHQTCPAGAGHPGPERWSAYFFSAPEQGTAACVEPAQLHLLAAFGTLQSISPSIPQTKSALVSQETKAHTSAVPLSLPRICRGPSKAGNGASRSRLLPQGGFGGTLGGDLPGPSLSALHQNGGSLRRGGDGTRPLLGVLRNKRYSETRNNVSSSILPVKCPSVKGVYLIS